MKKFVLGLGTIAITMSMANAWDIAKKIKSGNNQYDLTVICDNGSAVSITENTYTGKFYTKGLEYNNLNSTVKKACSTSPKLYSLKNEAIVCRSRMELKDLLAGDGRAYKLEKVLLGFGPDKKSSCILAKSSSKVRILKEYKHETFEKKYDDGKRKWTETVNLCDSYFKIEAGNNIYYVRKSDIQF